MILEELCHHGRFYIMLPTKNYFEMTNMFIIEEVYLLCAVYSLPVSLHVYDFNAQHGAIKHKVPRLIEDDAGQSDAVHLLQLSLHRHSAAKLHIRQLLPHLLELREHLPLIT